MPVTVSGAGNCADMSATAMTGNAGVATIILSSSSTGLHSGCSLFVTDHAGLDSNTIALDDIVFGTVLTDFCLFPTIDVPQSECEALVELYIHTNGDNWNNNANWMQSTTI